MIYKIVITADAKEDLKRIYEYIAEILLSPQNAIGQLDRLEKCILKLNQMPFRFRKYEREPWYSRGMHIMPVDNFVVLYIPDEEKSIVTIIRVMYGGRDIDEQLGDL